MASSPLPIEPTDESVTAGLIIYRLISSIVQVRTVADWLTDRSTDTAFLVMAVCFERGWGSMVMFN